MLNFFKSVFNFREQKRQSLQLILLAFLISFAIVHTYSIVVGDSGSIYYHGFHIHHFYFGMLTLSIGGVIALLSDDKKMLRVASLLVGTGIGLFADEIGLLLNCTSANRACTYAFPDTLDIIGCITVVLVLALVAVDYFERRNKKS